MSVAVGDKRVELAAAQRGFVNSQIGTDILRIQNVFFGMIKLPPAPVIAEYLLVLSGQIGSVNAIMRRYRTDAFRGRLNPPLLKKLRTPGLADCLPPQAHSRK